MCKHVLNAQVGFDERRQLQVSIRAPCCGKWFDCAKCHEEQMDHPLQRSNIMVGERGRGEEVDLRVQEM